MNWEEDNKSLNTDFPNKFIKGHLKHYFNEVILLMTEIMLYCFSNNENVGVQNIFKDIILMKLYHLLMTEIMLHCFSNNENVGVQNIFKGH